VLGHLEVAAAAALGEADDPLDAGLRLGRIAREQRLERGSGALADLELDPHRTARVEAAPDDPACSSMPTSTRGSASPPVARVSVSARPPPALRRAL
jgi:hypothetical protein